MECKQKSRRKGKMKKVELHKTIVKINKQDSRQKKKEKEEPMTVLQFQLEMGMPSSQIQSKMGMPSSQIRSKMGISSSQIRSKTMLTTIKTITITLNKRIEAIPTKEIEQTIDLTFSLLIRTLFKSELLDLLMDLWKIMNPKLINITPLPSNNNSMNYHNKVVFLGPKVEITEEYKELSQIEAESVRVLLMSSNST